MGITPQPLCTRKKNPNVHLIGKLVGRRAGLDDLRKKSLVSVRIRKQTHPEQSLVTIPNTLSRIRTLANTYGNRGGEREEQVLS